ncbi:MAG: radical SAM protein [Calditrichaeota bacterium]|nr:MAG: radical SAM protein [Calditrichota bacterium]
MPSPRKNILLFNPWIYDFAAYDFWTKPLGLLYIGSVLRQAGFEINLIDCLDRFHPLLLSQYETPPAQYDFSGKYLRQEIEKPEVLKHVPRKYCRYGLPPHVVLELLDSLHRRPDVICVTSSMTYWYPAVRDAVIMLRQFFPQVPIILGGIYATLCPAHAQETVHPTWLLTGGGEKRILDKIAQISDQKIENVEYQTLDDLPFPAFDLYSRVGALPLLTSRGCPNVCSFCASRILSPEFRHRSPENVFAEIQHWNTVFNVTHFSFFDDALLHQADHSIKPLLRKISESGLRLYFHTPNGMAPKFIDDELSALFKAAGVDTLRLSYESSDPKRQQSMSAKVTTRELKDALNSLEKAGYRRDSIGVYILFGLPGQTINEVKDTAQLVHDLGARLFPASFSPIPGTLEWRRAIEMGVWNESDDLLLSNTTLFPIWSRTFGYEKCLELVSWLKELNRKLHVHQLTEFESVERFQLVSE